jgi:hypothetical protein
LSELTHANSTSKPLLRFAHEIPKFVSIFLPACPSGYTHHMAAHPSGSWKLSAISVTFDSVQTMRVSGNIVSTRWRWTDEDVAHLVVSGIRHLWRFSSRAECALARLRTGRVFELHPIIARLVSNCPSHVMKSILGLARDAIAMNENNAVVSTHVDDLSCTEASASIKPVVGFEFVDLDSLPLIRIHCRRGQFRAGPVWAANASGLSTVGLVPCRARLL